MGREHYLTLDAARGVAAIAVLLTHISYLLKLDILAGGYLSVDFFFVLSGFVVAAAYEGRLKAGMSFRRFAAVRMKRLYPLYLAGTLLGFTRIVILPLASGHLPHDPVGMSLTLATALLMAPGMIAGMVDLYPYNPPAWSLFFEVVANAVYAAIARWLTTPVLVALSALGLAACVGFVAQHGHLGGGPKWTLMEGGFARVTFSFFAGVLIFRLRGARLPKPSNLGALAILVLLAVAIALAPGRSVTNLIPVVLVFPALVWFGAGVQPTGRFAAIARRAGPLSYALYATHIPVLDIVARVRAKAHLAEAPTIVVAIVACCLVAWLTDRFWDGPVRRWLSRGSKRAEAPVTASA